MSLNIIYIFSSEILETPIDVCRPSPCGPNSRCQEVNKQAVCSCEPGYIGVPPGCHPECVTSAECPREKACINQKCENPCLQANVCGTNAECKVINHNPICTCIVRYTGDPFTRCNPIPRKLRIKKKITSMTILFDFTEILISISFFSTCSKFCIGAIQKSMSAISMWSQLYMSRDT